MQQNIVFCPLLSYLTILISNLKKIPLSKNYKYPEFGKQSSQIALPLHGQKANIHFNSRRIIFSHTHRPGRSHVYNKIYLNRILWLWAFCVFSDRQPSVSCVVRPTNNMRPHWINKSAIGVCILKELPYWANGHTAATAHIRHLTYNKRAQNRNHQTLGRLRRGGRVLTYSIITLYTVYRLFLATMGITHTPSKKTHFAGY